MIANKEPIFVREGDQLEQLDREIVRHFSLNFLQIEFLQCFDVRNYIIRFAELNIIYSIDPQN